MSHELIYTSAPRGLKPGSQGFCTVMSTQGIPPALVQRLESLSGYRHVYAPQDANAALNPVTCSHLLLTVGNRRCHVLSRICNAGLDYTQRTNKFAHHVVLDPAERVAAGPARLLAATGFMQNAWSGEPAVLPSGRRPPPGDSPPTVCRAWKQLTGDAGWGGVLAETAANGVSRPAVLIFRPGMDLLPLIVESLALLPPATRWNVSFSTYFNSLPAGVDCQWRCVLEGSPEAVAARRLPRALIIDLCSPPAAPPAGPYVDAARRGVAPVAAVAAGRPVTAASLPDDAELARLLAGSAPSPSAPTPAVIAIPEGAYDLASLSTNDPLVRPLPPVLRAFKKKPKSVWPLAGGIITAIGLLVLLIFTLSNVAARRRLETETAAQAEKEEEAQAIAKRARDEAAAQQKARDEKEADRLRGVAAAEKKRKEEETAAKKGEQDHEKEEQARVKEQDENTRIEKEKQQAEIAGKKKREEEKLQAEVKTALAALPKAFSLPKPAEAFGESPPSDKYTIGKAEWYVEGTTSLRLLRNKDTFGEETTCRFEKIAERPPRWQCIRTSTKGGVSPPSPIAEFAIENKLLNFTWCKLSDSTIRTSASQLRNCLLEITSYDKSHVIQLRSPKEVPPPQLAHLEGMKPKRAPIGEIENLPNLSSLQVELLDIAPLPTGAGLIEQPNVPKNEKLVGYLPIEGTSKSHENLVRITVRFLANATLEVDAVVDVRDKNWIRIYNNLELNVKKNWNMVKEPSEFHLTPKIIDKFIIPDLEEAHKKAKRAREDAIAAAKAAKKPPQDQENVKQGEHEERVAQLQIEHARALRELIDSLLNRRTGTRVYCQVVMTVEGQPVVIATTGPVPEAISKKDVPKSSPKAPTPKPASR